MASKFEFFSLYSISFGIQRFVNDEDTEEAVSDSESKSKATSAFSPWQDDRRNIGKGM